MALSANILLVDDTLENLQVLGDMLRRHGYRVRPVPSGKLALQACAAQPPELILLDINMPEMNGYEVCTRLKADPALAEIPVLFISALAESMDKVKAFGVGGVDYITKPFQVEEVEARVATHIAMRRQRLELQANYDRIRALEEMRKNLSRLIVHDLRNPLNVIDGFVDMVLETNPGLGADSRNFLERARSATRNLIDLTNSLLDVNRMEDGVMKLTREPVDVSELCRDAVRNVEIMSEGRTVTVVCAPGAVPVASVDRSLVRRIIQNILGNALKFTDRTKGKITLSVGTDGNRVSVAIADNGPGIPAEFHKRIFDKYFQVQGTQIQGVHSTGLGLSFCKMGVELHGGEIGVESAPGVGTTFRFTLPVVAPESSEPAAQPDGH